MHRVRAVEPRGAAGGRPTRQAALAEVRASTALGRARESERVVVLAPAHPLSARRRPTLNPATMADTAWLPLINTPGYHEQPSGLSSASAAMATSLEGGLRPSGLFSVTSVSSNTIRSCRSFSDGVDEDRRPCVRRHPPPEGWRGRAQIGEDVNPRRRQALLRARLIPA